MLGSLAFIKSALFFPLSPLTRWIWCLHYCVLRKCHTGAVYRRDCRRSDWLWIPGYYTHLVLLSSWWWCFGTGNGKLLLTYLPCLSHSACCTDVISAGSATHVQRCGLAENNADFSLSLFVSCQVKLDQFKMVLIFFSSSCCGWKMQFSQLASIFVLVQPGARGGSLDPGAVLAFGFCWVRATSKRGVVKKWWIQNWCDFFFPFRFIQMGSGTSVQIRE